MGFMRKMMYFLVSVLFLLIGSAVWAEDSYRHYALACPFQTVTDEISLETMKNLILSEQAPQGEIRNIYLSSQTAADLESLIGEVPEAILTENVAERITKNTEGVDCALILLNEADPTMKLIRLEHTFFPWDDVYDPAADPLAVPSDEPNFDRDRVTTILLTGTTAFARTVAYKMSVKGVTYPAELIKSVFESSDITHISNESSFWSQCPVPRREDVSIQFCSGPEAVEILDYLGVAVVELTGNHLRDYDWMPFAETLDLLDNKGYASYGAGRDITSAAEPLFLEHNGNRFVFLGCNCAGPDHVYATETLPGVLPCDFDWMEKQVREYSAEGWQVIVTLQYYEIYSHTPSDIQKRDFQRLSDAGAVIVSGSQAHLPQIMLPLPDRFVHYGLGNLFFDQMDVPVKGTRQEFLDRYIFYDGRLLSVQLITAYLTDYCRPRLMTDSERSSFLEEIFSLMPDS
ncbi:MAG: CapA family protein [Flexilinea sp.]|nr:CapA family protein [Flexilinea sp.]